MEEFWIWISELATDLGPITILIQFVLWSGIGALCCWRFLLRRLSDKEASIAKLEVDATYWEGEFYKKKN